jgi:hypothetical protein
MSASAVLKLQKVGFTVEQVEALADFMDTQAASKADLVQEASAIRADFEAAEHRLETKIADTKSSLKADIAETRADLKLLEQRITIKFGSMMMVAVGVILAAIRYLPQHL